MIALISGAMPRGMRTVSTRYVSEGTCAAREFLKKNREDARSKTISSGLIDLQTFHDEEIRSRNFTRSLWVVIFEILLCSSVKQCVVCNVARVDSLRNEDTTIDGARVK